MLGQFYQGRSKRDLRWGTFMLGGPIVEFTRFFVEYKPLLLLLIKSHATLSATPLLHPTARKHCSLEAEEISTKTDKKM